MYSDEFLGSICSTISGGTGWLVGHIVNLAQWFFAGDGDLIVGGKVICILFTFWWWVIAAPTAYAYDGKPNSETTVRLVGGWIFIVSLWMLVASLCDYVARQPY